jgi:hypothetical protein
VRSGRHQADERHQAAAAQDGRCALAIVAGVTFRDRLLATLRAARPVFEAPGVVVVGSQVPNLREPGAAATLVVSQDVDVGVPVASLAAVKAHLPRLEQLQRSTDEPSVWVPQSDDLLELNFIGIDPALDPAEVYALDDDELPLMVFGPLSFIRSGDPLDLGDMEVPLPRSAGLIAEKLVTERTGEKGDRDLLVALGLLETATSSDLNELETLYRSLRPELQHAIRSNLTILSLIEPRAEMPDPRPRRAEIAALLRRLDAEHA